MSPRKQSPRRGETIADEAVRSTKPAEPADQDTSLGDEQVEVDAKHVPDDPDADVPAARVDAEAFLDVNRKKREAARVKLEKKQSRRDGRGGRKPVLRWSRRGTIVTAFTVLIGALIITSTLAIWFGISRNDLTEKVHRLEQQGNTDAARTAVLASVKSGVAAFGTYDVKNYGDLDNRIRAVSTAKFAKSYIDSSQDSRKKAASAGVNSKAVVGAAGIESLSADNAVVIGTFDQTASSPEIDKVFPGGRLSQSRVKVTVTSVDGRWLVDNLEFI